MHGHKRSCEEAARGDEILQNGSNAELEQELRGRGVPFGAKLTTQELQQLLKLALENIAMREQLKLAASPEGLSCSVCTEDFNDNDRAPRNLSCGHSPACTQCLTSMSARDSVVCPVCRVVTPLPSSGVLALTKNFHLMYTVGRNRQLAASVKRPADGATSAWAGVALQPSKRAAAAPDHSTCSAHTHKQVDVLCHTCRRAVCSLCLLSTCIGHKKEDIEGIAMRCKQGQLAACESAKQRFRTAVADAAASAKVKMSAAIDGNAARLLARGDVLYDNKCSRISYNGAFQFDVDNALRAGSAGIAGGHGAEKLLQAVRSAGEVFEVVTGFADAVYPLGVAEVIEVESTHELHLEGHKLLPTNPHLAFQCFAGAAARGHGPSHAQLAHMHLNGHSAADKNVARAHELAARGAALGCSDSKGVLGWLTYKGRGVFRNKQTGEQLMRESADAGSAWGQWALGLMYFQRQSRMPAEIHLEGHCREETVRYFRMAAERGHSDAQFYLGRVLEGRVDEHFKVGWGRDINEAARFYLMAAQQGHSAAQTKLGKMFEWKGEYHMNEAVLGEIVRYFRWGAERGHSAAQVYFGFLLRDGRGVAQDSAEAERYFIMAAEQGNSEAMFQLGEMYHKKWEKNDPTGSNWYRLGKRYYSAAEEHGHWAVGWPPDRWR